MTDGTGYQHQLTASVIANKGFINTFAPVGTTKLNPSHVSAWGGIYRQVSVSARTRIFRADRIVPDRSAVNSVFLLSLNDSVEKVNTFWSLMRGLDTDVDRCNVDLHGSSYLGTADLGACLVSRANH
jgi:hypothetical protein